MGKRLRYGMNITGKRIKMRSAKLSERKKLYGWMTKSNITRSIMGPPAYPDATIPSWEEFRQDYTGDFFKEYEGNTGKCFLILYGKTEVGTISYDLLNRKKKWVLLDIWLRSEKYCGHGYGPEALNILCLFLHRKHGITSCYISPSFRNKRAVAAYRKAGFLPLKMNGAEAKRKFGIDVFEYADNIMMKKAIKRSGSSSEPNRNVSLRNFGVWR